jgi:diguanylate cyclase (GGDEF)-like protein
MLVAYTVHLALDLGGGAVVRTALLIGIVAPAVGTCVAAGAMRRRERTAWLVLAAAVAGYGTTAVAYTIDIDSAHSFPTYADVGLFAFYPLMLVGLVMLIQRRLGRLRPSLWLDALTGALAMAVLGAVALLSALAGPLDLTALGQFAYFVGDLVLLGFLLATAVLVGLRPGRLLLALGLAAVLLVAADGAYAIAVAGGDGTPGLFSLIAWPGALLALSAAGWQPALLPLGGARIGWRDVAMPLVAACICLPVMALSSPAEPIPLALASAGLGVVLARLATTLAQNVGLLRVQERAPQQALVAGLGRRALEGEPLASLLSEATRATRELLGADTCAILEPRAGTRARWAVVAEAGWPTMAFGEDVDASRHTLLHHLMTGPEPVLFDDLSVEARFASPFLAESGVISGAAVLITAHGRTLGALGVFARSARRFTREDLFFLESVANVLAEAIERRRTDDELRHQALHDSLTGLPNRTLLLDRLTQALAHRSGDVGVLFIDLDRFKEINDSLGHAVGDELLEAVGERLAATVRLGDTVARLSGDEFAVVCDVSGGLPHAEIARRAANALREPFLLSGEQHFVTASVGVAVGAPGMDADELIGNADAAMYAAKLQTGMSSAVFDEDMRGDTARRIRLQHDLNRALPEGQLCLVYQPIVDLADDEIIGAEALVRWEHPEYGAISPEVFVPLAERTGLIVEIGEWILMEACRQASEWRRGRRFTLGVNFSPRQLVGPDLVDLVAGVMEGTDTPPDQFCVEITETALIDASPAVTSTLAELKALGTRLALDDFGTGFSSLSHLQRYPIDVIKIDRSFVRELPLPGPSDAIVIGVMALGEALGLDVIAEGIESAEQARHLVGLGCRQGQGYHFSGPVSATQMTALMARQPTGVRPVDATAKARSAA